MHLEEVVEIKKLNIIMVKLEKEVVVSGVVINVTQDYHQQVEELLVSILKLQS
jgi:hypothetical protein